MEFAVNYSPVACKLLEDGIVEFDRIKCASDWPDTFDQARVFRPIYLHFPFHAGNGGMDKVDWELIRQQIDETKTSYIDTHLAPRADSFPHISVDSCSARDEREIFDALMRDIIPLVERFGPNRVLLEHANWNPGYPPPYVFPLPAVDPALITRIVRETGCGFLLDIGHARCVALARGINEREYISALPVDQIREIHLSGLREESPGVWVDHWPLNDDDWKTSRWVFDRIGAGDWPCPWVASFEYGGVGSLFAERNDPSAMAEQIPRMYEMVKAAC